MMWKCEKCGELIDSVFDTCWKCADAETKQKITSPKPYTKCIACGSDKLAEGTLKSTGVTHGEVQIASKEKDSGLTFLPHVTSSRLNVFVCGDCGHTTFFSTNFQNFYQTFRESSP